MSVHYKFKSALEYDTVTFDGLHISVRDLKNAIIQQKRIGKNTDFDLQVTNAQTKEVYSDETALIHKNTSLLIARIPLAVQGKQKAWDGYGGTVTPPPKTDDAGPVAKAVDLASIDASEEDKIKAMMSQSTQDYDPSNYLKIRGANQVGSVPLNYRCFKCHQGGHWIKDCPLSQGPEPIEIKKSTGIPRSFMVPVEGPQVPGAMMTPNGSFAVPVLDHQAYNAKPIPAPVEKRPEIPDDLLCSICSDLLADAVMIPCCGNSFCDECIRSSLLESEEHECPDCHERDISPGTLIPNRFLRNAVSNFKTTTGYVKRPVYKPATKVEPQTVEPGLDSPLQKPDSKGEASEKTVISEADSTEPPKVSVDFTEDIDIKEAPNKAAPLPEGPPGVSPHHDQSPKAQPITSMANAPPRPTNGRSHHKNHSQEPSPRRSYHLQHSPSYSDAMSRVEDRPGTPTVDEPGIGSTTPACATTIYPAVPMQYPSGPPLGVVPMMGMPPPNMQGPPPTLPGPYASGGGQPPTTFLPPTQGPPPNFRMPPPGSVPPSYMQGPYSAQLRPMYDPTRPPMQGPPPNYAPAYSQGPRQARRHDSGSLRRRTPPGVIDDPLEAFNRMIREKDERERRKKRRGRSYSRSSSRSYSRTPPPRRRTRSPRRHSPRSRSRSFTMSSFRSRSRSFSPSPRGTPIRDYSPRGSPRRRGHSRYHSPIRSPPRYRFKDTPKRDFERDRDYTRDDREYSREFRDREHHEHRERDFRFFDSYESYERDRTRNRAQWGQPPVRKDYAGAPSGYYPPEIPNQQPYAPPPNRYPPREVYPSHHLPPIQQPQAHLPPIRRYEDVAPPGTEQPPIPGLENAPRYEDRYQPYDRTRIEGTERFSPIRRAEKNEEHNEPKHEVHRSPERRRSPFGRPSKENQSPAKTKDRHGSPHKRKRRDDSVDKEKEDKHPRKKEVSDDEKLKKSKEKKKKKEKKEAERKKKKEKKEKRELKKAEDKAKEAVKQVEEKVEDEKVVEAKPVEEVQVEPKVQEEKVKEVIEEVPTVTDLYGDILSEGIDNSVVENYGKIKDAEEPSPEEEKPESDEPSEEVEATKDYEDSEKDILELHMNEAELKSELDASKNEMLAPLPEKSKWEDDEDLPSVSLTDRLKFDPKADKPRVSSEVLKRAENAIFAKAINAIRPIEIKKISVDRAKLYSGERDKDRDKKDDVKSSIHVTIPGGKFDDIQLPGGDSKASATPRLSVKERLGCKVDEIDRIVKVEKPYDRNRSSSLSPLSKRAAELNRNFGINERRVEVEERPKHPEERVRHVSRSRYDSSSRDRHHRNYRNPAEPRSSSRRDHRGSRDEPRRDYREVRRDRDRDRDARDNRKADPKGRKDDRSRSDRRDSPRGKAREPDKDKKRRSRSSSKDQKGDKDKRKKKDKKQKKDKVKKHKKDEDGEAEKAEDKANKKEEAGVKVSEKPRQATDRRKPTLDEANFEPDYDLESESEKEDEANKEVPKRKIPSKSPEIESVKKKPKLEVKKKESSSSGSSESSSDDDKKKKKHRKHKKKKAKKDSSSSSSGSESDSSDDERDKKRKKHKKKQKKKKKSKHK